MAGRSRAWILNRYYFARIRPPKRWGFPTDFTSDRIVDALVAQGIPVESATVDVDGYHEYFDRAEYSRRYPGYYQQNLPEKSLEHFLAEQLLGIGADDVYIDVASETSPVPEILQRLHGCRTYAQDLVYEPGIHGSRIGSNAAAMPVPDGFATKMALHCSFEHFEGDADTRFVQEASRVLRPGGRLVIVPLYLASRYSIETDPLVSGPQGVPFERDAVVVAIRGWANRHGRFYDAPHLLRRVVAAVPELKMKVVRFVNFTDVHPSCYAEFALVAERA